MSDLIKHMKWHIIQGCSIICPYSRYDWTHININSFSSYMFRKHHWDKEDRFVLCDMTNDNFDVCEILPDLKELP